MHMSALPGDWTKFNQISTLPTGILESAVSFSKFLQQRWHTTKRGQHNISGQDVSLLEGQS
jgi:hypothetical protein